MPAHGQVAGGGSVQERLAMRTREDRDHDARQPAARDRSLRRRIRLLLSGVSPWDVRLAGEPGGPLDPQSLSDLVRKYVQQSGIRKRGGCHLFRHAMATHMLENGADIRFIQAMLGHGDISSTQVYTQVSVEKLRAVHRATHPRGLKREREPPSDKAE